MQTNTSELNSASEIKNAVFDAWNKVKSESAKIEATPSVPEMKVKTVLNLILINMYYLFICIFVVFICSTLVREIFLL